MKAIRYERYGPPQEVVELRDVPEPTIDANGILVKVHAASVNPLEWHQVTGTPYVVRLSAGLRRPKTGALGTDVAGTVVAVGADVVGFQPGDEVFGGASGAYADFVRVTEKAIVHKPAGVGFEEAAAVPVAGYTALQGLRDKGALEPGDAVLVIGASGGVGTFAVQIARAFGAEVAAVCSTRNVDMVRSLGADRVIDYTTEDFAARSERYDVVLDMVGGRPVAAYRAVLAPEGTYVSVGGKMGDWVGPLVHVGKLLAASFRRAQKMRPMLARQTKSDLLELQRLLATGAISSVVDRRFDLAEVGEALRRQGEGHARGKTIIAV